MTEMKRRKATTSQWTSANPVLRDDEIALSTDTGFVRIGDGLTPWTSLPEINSNSGGGGGSFDPDTAIPYFTLADTDLEDPHAIGYRNGGLYEDRFGTDYPLPVGTNGLTLTDGVDLSGHQLMVQEGVLYFDGYPVLLQTPETQARMLPTDGTNDMQLLRDTSGSSVGKWQVKDPLGKYRGTWGPDEALALYDFSTGALSPFTAQNESSNTAAATVNTITTAPGSTPAYTNMLQLPGSNVVTSGSSTGAEIDITSILNGRTPTRVKFFDSVYRNTSTAAMVGVLTGNTLVKYTSVNSSTLANPGYTPWTERTINLGGATLLRWKAQNTASGSQTNSRYYVAGIRVYGTPNPYLYGDTVDYAGKLYRSEINNNADTPGAAGVTSWTLITYP